MMLKQFSSVETNRKSEAYNRITFTLKFSDRNILYAIVSATERALILTETTTLNKLFLCIEASNVEIPVGHCSQISE